MQCSTLPHECVACGEGTPCIHPLQRIVWRHYHTVGSHKIMEKDVATIRSRSTIPMNADLLTEPPRSRNLIS